MSAYLMVSLHSDNLNSFLIQPEEKFKQHDWWDDLYLSSA
jgi:hypothetical protein